MEPGSTAAHNAWPGLIQVRSGGVRWQALMILVRVTPAEFGDFLDNLDLMLIGVLER